jgi:hypothetical protein
MRERELVIATTYRQFEHARRGGLVERSADFVPWGSVAENLRGRHRPNVTLVMPPYTMTVSERRQFDEFDRLLRMVEATVTEVRT